MLEPGGAGCRRRVLRHRHRGRDAPQPGEERVLSSPRPCPSWPGGPDAREEAVGSPARLRTARSSRAARDQRPAPFVDRTRYTTWNAMMASAHAAGRQWSWTTSGRPSRARYAGADCAARENRRPTVAHTPGGIRRIAGRPGADRRRRARRPTRSPAIPRGSAGPSAIMDRVWREYWDEERRRSVRHRQKGREDETGCSRPRVPSRSRTHRRRRPTASPGSSRRGCTSSPAMPALAGARVALVAAFAGRAAELGLYAATYLLALDWQAQSRHSPRDRRRLEGDRAPRRRCIGRAGRLRARGRWSSGLTREAAGSRPLPPGAQRACWRSATAGLAYFGTSGSTCSSLPPRRSRSGGRTLRHVAGLLD